MKTHPIDGGELSARIARNRERLLTGKEYDLLHVFSPPENEWKGDMEGRALLAFLSHYKIDGTVFPCMDQLLAAYAGRTEGRFVFTCADNDAGILSEQQLSGHSWLLRGLCEHYECFGDALSLSAIRAIVSTLYLPIRSRLSSSPTVRRASGGVSGNQTGVVDGWRLSTDTGCAFMSVDGLSHAYAVTGDETLRELLDAMITVFLGLDWVSLRCQTHCTLTAARGLIRMFDLTGERRYLEGAVKVWRCYTSLGMTCTYQNLNWWGRPDSWTEPCAVVDSLMLSLELFRLTGEALYRTTAARIWANGFASLQRDNGGAGTDTLVTPGGGDTLRCRTYEAWFCCTMRLAEGLWYADRHRNLLEYEAAGTLTKTPDGVYMDGDLVYAQVPDAALAYAGTPIRRDGILLTPLLKFYRLPQDLIHSVTERVIFR